ncbi:conserved hypothetical protein [Vibrio cholerae RC385]|nr:conserved hypothetical protein [Vibrio cholerae RC385]
MLVFSDFEMAELSTRSTKSASGKTQKQNSATRTLKTDFSGHDPELFMIFSR